MRQHAYRQISFGGPLTPVVKALIITCGVTFILQHLAGEKMLAIFGLIPYTVYNDLFVWQLVSYIFVHGDIFHLIFNLIALYVFGCELERRWNSWFFFKYFFICGVGAGISTVCLSPSMTIPTVGASGSIFGILLAYAFYFPNRKIYINFIFPIKVKYLVLLYGLLTFYFSFSRSGGNVAHIAHLGGMACGFIYLNFYSFKHLIMKQIRKYKARRIRKRYRVIDGGGEMQRGR